MSFVFLKYEEKKSDKMICCRKNLDLRLSRVMMKMLHKLEDRLDIWHITWFVEKYKQKFKIAFQIWSNFGLNKKAFMKAA